MMRTLSRLSLTLFFAMLSACGSQSESGEEIESTLSAERIEQLRALGYVDSSPTVAEASKAGAVVLDRGAAAPGYSLYVAPLTCSARLIDLDGTLVHSWQDPISHDGTTRACSTWHHAELLPDGDILVPVNVKPRANQRNGTHLLRMAWDGTVRWRRILRAHHDAEQAPDGQILTLELAFRRDHPYDPELPIMDNSVIFHSPEGRRLRRISIYDVLRKNSIGFELRAVAKGRRYYDLLHINSIETILESPYTDRHPLYATGNLLASSRRQDAIFILDASSKELVWAYGPDEFSGQHDAQMLPNGNILVFDNGLSRGWSRVVELDPVARKIVWQYGDGQEQHFFTAGRGAAQKLPNGNVLVANSNEGEAFEVTREGRVVWRFYHPELDDAGHRRVIVRMIRYPTEQIDALLGIEAKTQ